MRRLDQGDIIAFWELWEYYKTTLFLRLCLRWMGGNREDAEDALSGASIKAWCYFTRHAHEINNVKAWLARLLYNHCMNMHKSNQKDRHCTSFYWPTSHPAEVSGSPVQAPPEEAFLRCEMQMYLRSRVNQLPQSLRDPLVLYFFGNMAQRDIAAHLNLSYEVVRKRLQHARTVLCEQMTPYLEHGDAESVRAPLDALEDVSSRLTQRSAQRSEEITSQVVAIRMVRINVPGGIEHYVPLLLDHKPTRQLQKLATLRTYVQRHPSGWRKQMQLAHLLYTLGHWEEAIAVSYHLLDRQPLDLNVRLRLGQMLRLLGRQKEAIDVYEDALALTGKVATQHYVNGCMALCHRHWDEAVQSYTAAADLEPANVVYWRDIGLVWLRAGQPEGALQAFENILQDNPDDLVALTFSYVPLIMDKRYEEAQCRMERAWKLDPGNALALAQLIDSRCHMGQVWGDVGTHIKTLIRRAIQLAGETPDVQASRAHYHMARGEQNTGLSLLKQYTTNHANCPSGWHHYARWHLRSGAVQCAAAAIQQAYALDPNDPMIYQTACDILMSTGEEDDVQIFIGEVLLECLDRCGARP